MSQDLFAAIDGTWPAAHFKEAGGWTFRDGQGGGKRVCAATYNGPDGAHDLSVMEAVHLRQGCTPLVQVRGAQTSLDNDLEQQGFRIVDPTNIWVMPTGALTDIPIPRVTTFCIWEPLAIIREIWALGGVDAARLAVMGRAKHKTAILSRWNEKPAGAAFAAIHKGICMVHAVEVLPHQRRQGVAQWMMRQAAFWAQDNGANHLAVLCVAANTPANALYQGLGFAHAGGYHYRIKGDLS